MSTGKAAIQISDPPHGHVVGDRSESIGEGRILVFVRVQVSNERSTIRNGIGIGQILVIGPNTREIVGGQELRADRVVHAETIAGDRLAVNGSAGDRCVLDHLRLVAQSVSVRILFFLPLQVLCQRGRAGSDGLARFVLAPSFYLLKLPRPKATAKIVDSSVHSSPLVIFVWCMTGDMKRHRDTLNLCRFDVKL